MDLRPGRNGAGAVARRTPPGQVPTVKGIRPRRDSDLGPCARLLRVVYYEGHCPAEAFRTPRAWLDGEDLLGAWVAERLGEILGHVGLSRVTGDGRSALRWSEITGRDPARLGVVSRLFVRPRVRRRGSGTALLEVAAGAARDRGLVPVLELHNPGEDATGLCDRLGWRLLAVDTRREGGEPVPVHRYVAPTP